MSRGGQVARLATSAGRAYAGKTDRTDTKWKRHPDRYIPLRVQANPRMRALWAAFHGQARSGDGLGGILQAFIPWAGDLGLLAFTYFWTFSSMLALLQEQDRLLQVQLKPYNPEAYAKWRRIRRVHEMTESAVLGWSLIRIIIGSLPLAGDVISKYIMTVNTWMSESTVKIFSEWYAYEDNGYQAVSRWQFGSAFSGRIGHGGGAGAGIVGLPPPAVAPTRHRGHIIRYRGFGH